MSKTEAVHKNERRVGVLLVHGLNGNTGDMEELAEHLAARGMVTENILLPGHGTRVRDMIPVGWSEWAGVVEQECRELKGRCEQVFLVGHSLGGALCLHIAAQEEVAGVVALCAPLHMSRWMIAGVRFVKLITPVLPTLREDIRDPVARKRYTRTVYRWTPMAPVDSMFRFLPQLRAELAKIRVPALIIAAVHDHVVPVRDGVRIYEGLGSEDKELLILRRSYHVVMKDHDREEVFARTLTFIERQVSRYARLQEMDESA